MQESSSKDSVSQSHSSVTPKTNSHSGSFRVKATTQKKSQLQKALGEFDERGGSTITQRKSLLSDEDNMLHVGNEKRGTIIKDTKSRRWSFTTAMKDSLGGWFKSEKNKIGSTFKKPIPKKIVEASSTRTQVIKKAAQMGAMAGTDSLKKSVIKKPIPKVAHSSIRIKHKDVPKEIGNTKPRWTHIIEDEERTVDVGKPVSQKESAPPEPNNHEPQLLDAPDEHLLLPEHAGLIRTENIKKEYRTPRVSQVVTFRPTAPVVTKTAPEPKIVMASEVSEVKENYQTSGEETTVETITRSITNENEKEVEPETTSKGAETRTVVVSQIETPSQFTLEGFSKLSTSTTVMVILFIAVISISTFSWGVIENKSEKDFENFETVSNTNLIKADKIVPLVVGSTLFSDEVKNTITENDGFVRFETTPSETLLKIVAGWNDTLTLGIEKVEIGALNNNPFFVIKTSSREVGLASMLQLERVIPKELKSLYAVTESSRFSSRKMNNHDIRVLGDQNSSELVYMIRSDGLILIAKNNDDLAAIFDRAK